MKKYLFLSCSLFMIAFIWGNSLRDAPHSSEESQWVLDWIRIIFSMVPGIDQLTMHAVRKMAHLTEYTLLGLFVSLFFLSFRSTQRGGLVLCLGFLIASLDETLQLFSPGRSSQFSDVMLDTLGVFLGIVIAYVITQTSHLLNIIESRYRLTFDY